MDIIFNKRFSLLLREFELPEDLSFTIDIPAEVQEIIDSSIQITELGVTLSSNVLYHPRQSKENKTTVEDDTNHFHVDWYIEPADNKKAFMLGVKTLQLLADKFLKQKLGGIRFWYHFKTPALSKEWAQFHNLHNEGDEYYISDRLSFHTRREGENIVIVNEGENPFNALMIIDI